MLSHGAITEFALAEAAPSLLAHLSRSDAAALAAAEAALISPNIEVLNPQSLASPNDNLSTHTLAAYAVPAGGSEILVVLAGGVDATDASHSEPASATFDGNPMTKADGVNIAPGEGSGVTLFYLLGPSGTGDIVVTFPSPCEKRWIGAVTLAGALQQGPSATATGTSASSPINTNINAPDFGLVVDGLASEKSGVLAVTQGPDQVERIEVP